MLQAGAYDPETKMGVSPSILIAGNQQILLHGLLALEHFGIPVCHTYLFVSSLHEEFRAQTLTFAESYRWKAVFDYRTTLVPSSVQPARIERYVALSGAIRAAKHLALHCASAETLISGSYGAEVDRTIASLIPHSRFILVDDGNMTAATALRREAEHSRGYRRALNHNSHRSSDTRRSRARLTVARLLGVRDDGERNITFFTSHKGLRLGPGDDLVMNAYDGLRTAAAIDDGLVHFLGLPALRRGILSLEDFRKALQGAATYLAGYREVHYFLHPADTDQEAAVVREVWPRAKLVGNIRPYEVSLALAQQRPVKIVSFYSSALSNARPIAGPEVDITILELPLDAILNDRRRAAVADIVDGLSSRPDGFGRVPLPNWTR